MIFESIPAGLLVIDPHGKITVCNRCACDILGFSRDTITGNGWADLFFEQEDNILFNQILVDVIWEKKSNLHRLVSYTRPDGGTLYLSVTTSFIQSAKGLEAVAVLLDDITKLHTVQLHEKIILQEKEILQRDRTEGLQKLAMAIAHQVRNPATAIGGLTLRVLKTLQTDPTQKLYLQNILHGVRELETIVSSIQEYTQIPPVSRSAVPVCRVLEMVEEHGFAKALSLGKRLDLQIASRDFNIEVDCELLVQALNEILDNAIEFGGDEPIRIETSRDQTGLTLSISDKGAGIAPPDLPYVFDPFFTTKATGVGMGLCKAKRIIAEHGGQIRAERTEGGGTRITADVPYVIEPKADKRDSPSKITEHFRNDVPVLSLRGRLDATNAGEVRDRIRDCLKNGRLHIVIDMAELDFLDSSGLGSLIASLCSANMAGGDIRIAAARDHIRDVFALTRLQNVFDFYADSDAASKSFQDAHSPAR